MRITLKRCPPLRTFSQPVPTGHSSREFVIGFFFSVIIHVFLALLLWKVTNDRIPGDPIFFSINTPLIVSLTTIPADSDDLDRKSEAETIVTSKGSRIANSKTPMGTPHASEATSPIDKEALYNMEWNLGKIPKIKAEMIDDRIYPGITDSEAPGRNSLNPYLTPSHGLEAVNRFEQVFGKMSESELQNKKLEWKIDYIKKYEASLPLDCATYYMKKNFNGLFAIPLIIKDAISDSDKACVW